jgi:hypothetical protein
VNEKRPNRTTQPETGKKRKPSEHQCWLQAAADGVEFGGNLCGQRRHRDDGAQGDEGSDQSVLDQVLARLIVHQVLKKHFHTVLLVSDRAAILVDTPDRAALVVIVFTMRR